MEYRYDKAGALEKLLTFHGGTPSLKLAYRRDALGRLHQVVDETTGAALVTGYNYEPVPDLVRMSLPNNVRVETWHDKLGRAERMDHLPSSGPALRAGSIYHHTQEGYNDTN